MTWFEESALGKNKRTSNNSKRSLSISGKGKCSALRLWSSTEVADMRINAFLSAPEDVPLAEPYQMA